MKVSRKLFGLAVCGVMFLVLFLMSSHVSALTAGETYSVALSKVNSDGTVTQVDSTSATADSDGKITFSFSNVPTSPTTNFLVITVTDSSDNIARKSFVPAPPENGSGELGANELSTTQTDMILAALAGAGTDDPIVVAYGLILTRTPNISDADVANIAILGKLAIQNGFETFLTENGVSAEQLATFKQKLVYNQPNKDLSNFTALFKSAVDNPDQAEDDMAMAAGLIADIFIDAGVAAGIDLGLILAAHNAAGDVVQNNPEAAAAFAGISGTTGNVIDAAMSNFHMRIAAVKVKTSYANALNALNASGQQVTDFNNAVQAMITAMQNLDKQYGQYYQSPDLLTPDIKSEMDAAYQGVFSTFQSAIADSDANIAVMKANVVAAIQTVNPDFVADMLPPDMGTYWDMNGNMVNWPIPQVVAVNWVASVITAGGDLSYDRSTMDADLPVPSNMNWLNNPDYPSGTGSRNDYVEMGMPAFFAAFMGMQEDVQIAENTRWSLWSEGQQPTKEQEKAAGLAYHNNINLIISKLSGTMDGTTAISDEVKEALVKMMEHPSLN